MSEDKGTSTKLKIEAQKEKRVKEKAEREQRQKYLEEYLTKHNISNEDKEILRKELAEKESLYNRCKRAKVSVNDFETIKVIGRGGFGEVRLVVKKGTNELYAMKLMRKKDMLERKQVEHIRAERDILAQTHFTNNWVVKLYYSFQDDNYLYLVMEFMGAGDLMGMLIRENIFSHEMSRFYIAEILLALDSIHKLDYIHRDIKPDNILIGNNGHIKLTDFGLCTGFHRFDDSMTWRHLVDEANKKGVDGIRLGQTTINQMHDYKKRTRELAYSVVGTPDYTAPEVFEKNGYGKECDYFSVGCILYECLVGYPPFIADDAVDTCLKIINETDNYEFPNDVYVSDEAKDLIRHLVTRMENRYKSFDEIKKHPFFKGIDWNNFVETVEPPYKPKFSSLFDTSNFDDFEEEMPNLPSENKKSSNDIAFVGYTYKGFMNVCGQQTKYKTKCGLTIEKIFSEQHS